MFVVEKMKPRLRLETSLDHVISVTASKQPGAEVADNGLGKET
jgi:hypothetical protein